MNGLILRRAGVLVASVCATSLALAQEPAVATPPPWAFVGAMAGMGMLLTVAIIAVVFINGSRQNRDRLATIERIVASGQPVPSQLIAGEPPRLPLAEERRRDIRRGITLL